MWAEDEIRRTESIHSIRSLHDAQVSATDLPNISIAAKVCWLVARHIAR